MINFLKYRHICFIGSFVLFLVGAVAFVVNYQKRGSGFEYHIDFVGGTELTIAFDESLNVSELRSSMSDKGWKDLTIQTVGMGEKGKYKEFVVRVGETDEGLEAKFAKDLEMAVPDGKSQILAVSVVGAEVGKDIRWNSVVAVILSLLIIMFYVAIRSKYRFALGAVAAIIHDLLAVLVVFVVFREQISVAVLAAILAILGYSLNDTIVIFSRIRENMKKYKDKMSEVEITNLSINQTLRRTLFTSFSTLLTVVSILVLGGETLHGFALAMLVGVIAGTYSSVYIASPVMLAIGGSKEK